MLRVGGLGGPGIASLALKPIAAPEHADRGAVLARYQIPPRLGLAPWRLHPQTQRRSL